MKKLKLTQITIPFPLAKKISKKGFTLVELLVAMAVVSVLMTAMAYIFAPSLDIIRNVRHNVFADTVAIEIGDYVEERLIRSNSIYITSAGAGYTLDTTILNTTVPGYIHNALVINGLTGRIYDKHNIDNATKVEDIVDDENAIFLEPFYNESKYEIKLETDSGEKSFIKLITTPYRISDGIQISEQRTKSFFLLNNNIEITGDYDPTITLDSTKPYILIYYKLHDFST